MRQQRVRTEVTACLADGHWWTVGELAQTIDCSEQAVRYVLRDLETKGAVARFDGERPAMFGWAIETAVPERAAELEAELEAAGWAKR